MPTAQDIVESVETTSSAAAFDLGLGQMNLAASALVAETPAQVLAGTPLPVAPTPVAAANTALPISEAVMEEIVNRVVQRLSTQAVQEIAWEVVPELAELLIRKQLAQHPQPSH